MTSQVKDTGQLIYIVWGIEQPLCPSFCDPDPIPLSETTAVIFCSARKVSVVDTQYCLENSRVPLSLAKLKPSLLCGRSQSGDKEMFTSREREDISCDRTRFQRRVNLLFILAFAVRQDEKQAGMPIIFLLNESVGT